jgi:hypothetical protein
MRKYNFYISTVFALKTMNTIFCCWQWCVKKTENHAVFFVENCSVADPDPGSFLTPGSGIRDG